MIRCHYCFKGGKNYTNCLPQPISLLLPNVNYLLTSYSALICGCNFVQPGFQESAAAVGRAAGDKEETVAAPRPLPLPALQLQSKLPPSRLLPCLLLPTSLPSFPQKAKDKQTTRKATGCTSWQQECTWVLQAQQTDSCSKLKASELLTAEPFFASVRHQFSLILDSVANIARIVPASAQNNWLLHICSCCLLCLDWLECVLEWQ